MTPREALLLYFAYTARIAPDDHVAVAAFSRGAGEVECSLRGESLVGDATNSVGSEEVPVSHTEYPRCDGCRAGEAPN